jgi:hypothetical protein
MSENRERDIVADIFFLPLCGGFVFGRLFLLGKSRRNFVSSSLQGKDE